MQKLGSLVIDGELVVTGAFTPPPNSVGNTQLKLADPVSLSNQRHKFEAIYRQSRSALTTAETGLPLHVADANGTVLSVVAGIVVAAVAPAVVTVDVLKNGASILSAVISIDSTKAAYVKTAGVIAGTGNYVDGDVFEVVVTSGGGGTAPKGLFVQVLFDEGA